MTLFVIFCILVLAILGLALWFSPEAEPEEAFTVSLPDRVREKTQHTFAGNVGATPIPLTRVDSDPGSGDMG